MLRIAFISPLYSGQFEQGFSTWVELDGETVRTITSPSIPRAAFGSIPCTATIGATTWKTSVFPGDAGSGGFFLRVAKKVREAESLEVDAPVTVHLDILTA
ncbi:MAG: DUF1905 domain-containing protein [Promicromonosporaceae bacterium]|nr:DUF1905 domain-containing protein [Promicromonosporaceae bacterium]